jgi:DNA polymerase eta
MCSRGNEALASAAALQSHLDWHFARDLQDEDRGLLPQPKSSATVNKKAASSLGKKKTGRSKPEKGQSKLAFG